MKKLFYSLITILTINSSTLYALGLDEAIEILRSENLEIKSATLDVESAIEDKKAAFGSHFGKLDFIQDFASSDDAGNVFGFKLSSREANFGDFGFSDFDMANPNILSVQPHDLNYPDSRNFFQSKLKYELPLFTGFKISSYVDIMESISKIKKLQKSEVTNEKIYQIRKSFYDMALLRESTINLNKILQNIDTLQNITHNMIEVGYAKKVDMLEVRAKKGNVERLLFQMHSNQKLLYHYISFLLNRKITDIDTPSLDVEMPLLSNDDILNSNLDIQKANAGLNVKKSMVDVSKSSYYPMLGAFAETSTSDDKFFNEASDHASYTVGARLTWNIFNGGSDSANVEKSRLDFIKSKTQLALAKSAISLKVEKIRTEIESLDKEIESLNKELELAKEIYKNYEGRYKEKLSSMGDVLIKQSEEIEKILQLQQTRNKRNERIFALEKLANGDLQ